ncbi:MAG TPA: hypothetical protein P5232_00705 [Candidatus Moranbacteria bacterium]|nr:hypothetical protein [Candidatus Moranbacteria bacterium]
MIISHKYKFIFVKTAKTAGTSIEIFLDRYCDSGDVFTPFSRQELNHQPRNYEGYFNPIPEIYKNLNIFDSTNNQNIWRTFHELYNKNKFHCHIPAWLIRARTPKNIWNNYYKFCVERNPWEKIISGWHWYNKKYKSPIGLDEYIDFCEKRVKQKIRGVGVCPYNFLNYTDPITENILVDKIIRYENLEEEFFSTLKMLDMKTDGKLNVFAKFNVGAKVSYGNFYNVNQRKRIEKIFNKEINLRGYKFYE